MIYKTIISILIFVSTFFNVFAEEWTWWNNISVDIPEVAPVEVADVNVNMDSDSGSGSNLENTSNWSWEEVKSSLNAAATPLVPFKWKVWEYAEVNCDKDFYTQNVCDQCFDWWKIATWEKITNLFDSWTNSNTSEQIIYKEEQIFPEFINLWWNNTKWLINPQESDKFWKFANDIIWTKWKTNKEEFILDWNNTVNFLESEFWASYSMESTDKAINEPVWLLKISAAYHDIDSQWVELDKKTITECVAYYNNTTPKPTEEVIKQAVKVKTWPEIYALILIAFILWFMFIRYRKNV